ncbi:MAG TPA: ATP-binding protein [Usitatibacter sp.]|nr:ATP-binding protein [Usitatibacter sp.]
MPSRLRSSDPRASAEGGSSSADELTVRADGEEVRRASSWLDAACRERGVPPALVDRLVLCLNEVLANVIVHGGAGALAQPIGLVLEVTADPHGGLAGVTVSDAGVAFDPRSVAPRALPKSLEEASSGGLGLVMIRRHADWLEYRNQGGRNHVTFGARWKSP